MPRLPLAIAGVVLAAASTAGATTFEFSISGTASVVEDPTGLLGGATEVAGGVSLRVKGDGAPFDVRSLEITIGPMVVRFLASESSFPTIGRLHLAIGATDAIDLALFDDFDFAGVVAGPGAGRLVSVGPPGAVLRLVHTSDWIPGDALPATVPADATAYAWFPLRLRTPTLPPSDPLEVIFSLDPATYALVAVPEPRRSIGLATALLIGLASRARGYREAAAPDAKSSVRGWKPCQPNQ